MNLFFQVHVLTEKLVVLYYLASHFGNGVSSGSSEEERAYMK